MIYVTWHKNPDTDTIISSILFADYLEFIWQEARVIKLGNINNETKFVLNFVWISEPETILDLPEKSKIALVDHNEKSQAIDWLENYEVVAIVDHHKIGNFSSESPLFIRVEKLCSTASIIYKIMQADWMIPTVSQARLIISAILSDSLLFKSSTTTEEDKRIVEELNKIAKIDSIENYALDMFNAKSDLWDISVEDLIKIDYKEFDFNWTKAWIWTIETTNPTYSLWRKIEILEGMKKIKEQSSLDLIILSVVDILNERNITLVPWEFESSVIKAVFWADTIDNQADLWRRLSRKKEIVPQLTEYFK